MGTSRPSKVNPAHKHIKNTLHRTKLCQRQISDLRELQVNVQNVLLISIFSLGYSLLYY